MIADVFFKKTIKFDDPLLTKLSPSKSDIMISVLIQAIVHNEEQDGIKFERNILQQQSYCIKCIYQFVLTL